VVFIQLTFIENKLCACPVLFQALGSIIEQIR
jgi:hypothetical protein